MHHVTQHNPTMLSEDADWWSSQVFSILFDTFLEYTVRIFSFLSVFQFSFFFLSVSTPTECEASLSFPLWLCFPAPRPVVGDQDGRYLKAAVWIYFLLAQIWFHF